MEYPSLFGGRYCAALWSLQAFYKFRQNTRYTGKACYSSGIMGGQGYPTFCQWRLWLTLEAMGVLQIVQECDRLFQRFSGLRRRCHYAFPVLSRERAEDADVGEDMEIGMVIHRMRMCYPLFSFIRVQMQLWKLPPAFPAVSMFQANLLILPAAAGGLGLEKVYQCGLSTAL